MNDIPPPPERYRAAPYLAPPVVHVLTPAEVDEFCGRYLDAPYGFRACAVFEDGQCIIVAANDAEDRKMVAIMVHEDAHCRGWPANHPE
jgi:hypothetical protein